MPKDIKESQNYEMQKKQQRNSIDTMEDSNKTSVETTSVGVQVNLPVTKASSMGSPSLARKLAHLAAEPEEIDLERHLIRNTKNNYESKTLPRRRNSNTDMTSHKAASEAKPAPLRRGFTHDQMLGLNAKTNPAWREELNKIRSQRPIKISELIGNFEGSTAAEAAASEAAELGALKAKRRNSLQINLDPITLSDLEDVEAKRKKELALLKVQRRKSTPTLLTSTIESLKIGHDLKDQVK